VRNVAYLFLGCFLFSFSFFVYNHVFILLRYKKRHAALAMVKTKPINHSQPSAFPLDGKNKTQEIHRKRPPRLAPKTKTPDRQGNTT